MGVRDVYVPNMKLKVGGPRSFMRQFVVASKKQGIRITHNRLTRARAALVPISMPPHLLRAWKERNHGYVVQRLDGLFYDPETSTYDESRNLDARIVYDEFADAVIFQSNYSQRQSEYFWGKPRESIERSTIINGTDLNLFTPAKVSEKQKESPFRFVSTGNFRDEEMILPILAALDQLHGEFLFELQLVGPIANPNWVVDRPRSYLKCLGCKSPKQIAFILNQSDVFLFSFLNPNCPNSVIEATASGLPVVAFDSGAMQELCGFNAELLVPMSDHLIHKRSELLNNSEQFLEKIRLCLNDYQHFRNRVLDNREQYSIKNTVEHYLNVLKPKL